MQALAQRRAIFHSEADFQHAFAWEIRRLLPESDIRLELPVRTTSGAIHLDLLVRIDCREALYFRLAGRASGLGT